MLVYTDLKTMLSFSNLVDTF